MLINIKLINDNMNNLFNCSDEFYNNMNNLYYEFNNNKNYWKDIYSNYFFNHIENEKKQDEILYDELKKLINIYSNIIKKYKEKGNKIEFNFKNTNSFLDNLEEYISNLEIIINNYNNLNDSFAPYESSLLDKEKKKLMTALEKTKKFKNNTKNELNYLQEEELKIKRDILKINLEEIKENTLENIALGNSDKFFMNVDSVELSIKKLRFYLHEEELNYENLNQILIKIIYGYSTANRNELEELNLRILNAYKKIINNHKNNIELLSKNRENYITGINSAKNTIEKQG